jgi:mono/diheme cytochrome c family protein
MKNTHSDTLLISLLMLVGTLTLGILVLIAPQTTHSAMVGPVYSEDQLAAGRRTYLMVCAGCHAPDAHGIKGLGKPLVGSSFVNQLSDAEVLAFLQVGRPVDDPLNTTGVVMPARGGRPSMSDDDLGNVIAYVRSLNQRPIGVGTPD